MACLSCSLFDADESEETATEEPLKIESGYAFSVLDDADATWEMAIRRIKAELRRQGFTGNKSTIKGDPVRKNNDCLLYTSPSPRDRQKSRMPSSA